MDTSIPTTEQINAMTPAEYKVLENRLRAAAQRQGLRLEKSRRRDPHALDYGRYWLVEGPPPTFGDDGRVCNWRSRQAIVGDDYGTTLGGVADFLWGKDGQWWRELPVEQGTGPA